MLKQILTGSSVSALILLTGLSVPAQALEPAAQSQRQEVAQAETLTVTNQDVERFANAVRQLRVIQTQAQTQTVRAIEGEGLSIERFSEIFRSQQEPTSTPPVEMSAAEQRSFEQALGQVVEIQQNTQQQMQAAIQQQGLDVQRFSQIFTVVRQDPALRQQVETILQN